MAKEYIDKEAVCEDAKKWFQTSDMKLYNDCVQMVRDRVTALPAADVRENVKGEWVYSASRGWRYCSSCNVEPEPTRWQSRCFCPGCGAQMTDVPNADVGEFAKDTDVPGNTVRIIDRGGIGLYNGQLVTKPNRLTNSDRIRAMSDEELADYLTWHSDNYSRYGMCWLDWLKEDAKEK